MSNSLIIFCIATAFLSSLLWILSSIKKLKAISFAFSILSILSIFALFAHYASLFLTLQFQYAVVHQYANSAMPKALLFSSIWTGQSGSLLTWIMTLSIFIVFILKDQKFRQRMLPILFFFLGALLILFFRSDPFLPNPYLPSDGLGLNPVLSHPLLISHPPLAFIAYSAIVIMFAYAIIAIRSKDCSIIFSKIALFSKLAFASMSFTILLGSFWAYEVTGWGGYWSFDPIENGSMVAWLLLVVLLHYLKAFKRYHAFHRPIIITCILLMFSILHMVFLIRSGIISQLSAHAYLEGNLLWILLSMDIVVLVLPLIYFFSFQKNLPKNIAWKNSNKINLLLLSNYIMFFIAGLVFIHTHLPFLEQSISGNFTQALYQHTPWIIFTGTFILCIVMIMRFRRALCARGTSRYSPEKILVALLMSFFLCFLFRPTLQIGLFSPHFFIICCLIFLSLILLYALVCHWRHKSWKHSGIMLLHFSLPLLLLGSYIIALPSPSHQVHLSPQQTVHHADISASFTASIPFETQAYVGSITSFPVQVDTKNFSFTALPHIWKYHRTREVEELMIPSIVSRLGSDYHIVPTGKGFFRIKKDESRLIGNKLFNFISFNAEKLSDGIIKENFVLSFEKQGEVDYFQLSRFINQAGVHVRSDPVEIPSLDATFQVSTYQNEVLVILSPIFDQHMEVNFYVKPLAIVLRWSYYLIMMGSLWILGIFIFFPKKIQVTHAKKK